ncbi:hypothetical protein [Niallia sp. 03091]|uniref:hypothetical protein n=1 Tax=Niallia sp. 03091 TaxID=3458059 RepID=UPI0040445E09
MIGKVHVWYMTPEELAEYVKKHPIVPTEKPSGAAYSNIHEMKRQIAAENGARSTKEFWKQKKTHLAE